MQTYFVLIFAGLFLSACNVSQLNNPYPDHQQQQNILYSSFSERPKHLDPAVSYSSNEYTFIAQIYEPPLQYHYLKRPYQLEPLTATKMPTVEYLNAAGQTLSAAAKDSEIAYTDYIIEIKPGIMYQPHPALARDKDGGFAYHRLTKAAISNINTLADFSATGSRELVAEDYVYQIKRLAHPKVQSPIAEMMKNYIVGFAEFSAAMSKQELSALKTAHIDGVKTLSKYSYQIRIKGKYPQFQFWLAMLFFAPMPWEADAFYAQPGLQDKNISLDWYPIGTGAYLLAENNPNRRMILDKNPNFRIERYPDSGESGDLEKGLLKDAGKVLPFIERVVYTLEKESIPYWNKFLQGYYDASGISSDNFDQAVQFSNVGNAQLTPAMQEKDIRLETSVTTSIFYLGFNMLDSVVGGYSEQARKLRQALSIVIDYEEFISIFMNGRGIAAQGILPPGIYGSATCTEAMNRYVYNPDGKRKSVETAKQLLAEAGYKDGIDPKTGSALVLYFDTTAAGADDRARMAWYRKQLEKIGIKLEIRSTDYNRFQEKMRTGNAQIYNWGWNADYPDPENFFFLLYGANGKVKYGGENASNYQNPDFDRLFEQMRNMDNSEQRYRLVQQMQDIIRRDAPWVFGLHPKSFALYHSWYQNLKPNLMANNQLKYTRIDSAERQRKQALWNQAVIFPVILTLLILILLLIPAVRAYRRRLHATLTETASIN